MNIGASCVGRYFWFTDDCRVVEARLLQRNEHPHFWEAVDHCIYKRINLIVTIDTYLTNFRWNPTDSELTIYTDWLCKELINSGATKNNCKISYDNEPEEHDSKEVYTHKLNVVYNAVKGRFYVIGGNVCSDTNYLDYIAKNSRCEYLGVHFQSGATTEAKINYYGDIYKRIAKENNKRLTCTEANWFDVSTSEGYQMLLKQLIKAEEIGCEDFCVAVINQTFGYQNAPDDDANVWLAFLTDGVPRSAYWNDFVRIINEKKPVQRSVTEMIIKTIGHKASDIQAGYGCLLLNEVLNYFGYLQKEYINFTYSQYTRKALENFQTDVKSKYNITVDGRCGRMTWRYLFREIKDTEVKKKFQEDFEIIMSPYNINGDT